MVDIRLAKLPDRAPVRLTISLPPELHRALGDYAVAYEAAYGERESIAQLVPFMLASFLEADKAFAKRRKPSSEPG
jgi:hypothetical protein